MERNGKPAGKLTDYLKAQGCVKAALVNGPNGDFVSGTKADGSRVTLPVGKRSQNGSITEMNVLLIEEEGAEPVAVATMNNYETLDEVTL